MTFNETYEPDFSGLVSSFVENARRIRARRRDWGLLVQFIDEAGKLKEWSFADQPTRDKFIEKLERDNLPYAISPLGHDAQVFATMQ